MPKISFDQTINDISLDNLESLLSLSDERVEIDLRCVNLRKIFETGKHTKLLTMRDPSELDEEDRLYFYRLLEKKVYKLIGFLLETNKNLM